MIFLAELKETKGKFRFGGFVVGLSGDSIRTGQTKVDPFNDYRSIRFGIKTNTDNVNFVEIFGMEGREIVIFKQEKDDDGRRKVVDKKRIDFESRNDIPEGYHFVGVDININDDDGRLNLIEWDAIEYIDANLKNNDPVYISGDINWQSYTNRNNELKVEPRYVVKRIVKAKDTFDFEDEKFEEQSAFEQEFIVADVVKDSETQRVYVNAYVINYHGAPLLYTFVANPDNRKLQAALAKKLKFGDAITVLGKVLNTAVYEESEEAEEDEWGSEIPKGYQRTIRNTISELQIWGVKPDSYEKGRYTEADFISEDEEDEEDIDDFFNS